MSARHIHRFDRLELAETKRFLRAPVREPRCECGMTPDDHIADLERQVEAAEQRVLEASANLAEVLGQASGRPAEVRATVAP